MRFVVLGDLHYSRYAKPELCRVRDEFYKRLFESVLEQKPDAVFAIGDMVDNGYADEFEGLLDCATQTGINIHYVNGNHDVLQLTKAEIARYTGNPEPYYTLKYSADGSPDQMASFVVMDTPKEKNGKDHGGLVEAAQIQWLKQQIDDSSDGPLFVFGHHPLANATRWAAFPMLNIDNSRDIKMAFYRKQAGQAFYFCGHNHANSIVQKNNWTFCQSAAPMKTCDYRVVDFSPEEVFIQSVTMTGGDESAKWGKQMVEALGGLNVLPARGFASDRRFSVKLTPRTAANLSGVR